MPVVRLCLDASPPGRGIALRERPAQGERGQLDFGLRLRSERSRSGAPDRCSRSAACRSDRDPAATAGVGDWVRGR